MTDQSQAQLYGFLALIYIPKVNAPYADLEELAKDAGFDDSYVPSQPSKRRAWQKATNLGAYGLKVEPPPHKLKEIEILYGVEPKVRLYTKIISDSSPKLVRHIVRSVTVPVTKDLGDKRTQATEQLDNSTVCIMEFDTERQIMTSTGYQEINDSSGWVNGNLQTVIQELHDNVQQEVEYADNKDIRSLTSLWLKNNNATLMNDHGGGIFSPLVPCS